MGMIAAPDRGRIIIVNFELGGSAVPPEMAKSGRPCVVLQNNKIARGKLVTVVPLSSQAPDFIANWHHKMDHRSFIGMPERWKQHATGSISRLRLSGRP